MKCKVQLIGRLGAEPEIATLPNGNQVVTLSIATEEYWKDRQGQGQKRTTWHRVKFWSEGTIGYIERNVTKGQLVEIEGTFRYEEFTDREGVKQRVALINGTNILPLQPLSRQQDQAEEATRTPADLDDEIPF